MSSSFSSTATTATVTTAVRLHAATTRRGALVAALDGVAAVAGVVAAYAEEWLPLGAGESIVCAPHQGVGVDDGSVFPILVVD